MAYLYGKLDGERLDQPRCIDLSTLTLRAGFPPEMPHSWLPLTLRFQHKTWTADDPLVPGAGLLQVSTLLGCAVRTIRDSWSSVGFSARSRRCQAMDGLNGLLAPSSMSPYLRITTPPFACSERADPRPTLLVKLVVEMLGQTRRIGRSSFALRAAVPRDMPPLSAVSPPFPPLFVSARWPSGRSLE